MNTNWISAYGGNKQPQKFQAGGPMAPEVAPAGGAPDLEGMLMEYAETRDPQLAVAICDTLVELMAAQGGAPAGPPPGAEMAPAPEMAPPMARKGMKTSRGPIFKK